MGKRILAILGSTGSIGRQALEVVRQHPDLFEIDLLTANNNSRLLVEQALEFDANNVVICNPDKYREVSDALDSSLVKTFCGMDSVCDLVSGDTVDMVLTAMVGFSGLRSTVAAIEAGKPIALANKETLVAAGGIVMKLAEDKNVPVLPVDSEHSAIFQCLQGSNGAPVRKIHLTASGGPFRTWTKEQLEKATRKEALKHPNWKMGEKITIDSATMMNKGLEIIEAKWLFGVSPEKINVVVHPESIIHSMVEYADGAVIAQLGHPDMKEPIQYALGYPARLELDNRKLDFASLGSLSFHAPDFDRFPALRIAYESIRRGGNMPCVMNAANEIAVAAFLREKIGFYDICDTVEYCIEHVPFIAEPCLEDIFSSNDEAAAIAAEYIRQNL